MVHKRNFVRRIRISYLKNIWSTTRDEKPEISGFSGSKWVFRARTAEDNPSQCSEEGFLQLLAQKNYIGLSFWKTHKISIGGRFWGTQQSLNRAASGELGASAHFRKRAENSRNFEIPSMSANAIQMSLG